MLPKGVLCGLSLFLSLSALTALEKTRCHQAQLGTESRSSTRVRERERAVCSFYMPRQLRVPVCARCRATPVTRPVSPVAHYFSLLNSVSFPYERRALSRLSLSVSPSPRRSTSRALSCSFFVPVRGRRTRCTRLVTLGASAITPVIYIYIYTFDAIMRPGSYDVSLTPPIPPFPRGREGREHDITAEGAVTRENERHSRARVIVTFRDSQQGVAFAPFANRSPVKRER